MKNYERPIVVVNDELAEGVYAASGDGACWTISSEVSNEWDGAYKIFKLTCDHADNLEHISDSTTVTLTFNYPITDAICQEYGATASGYTVPFTRVRLGDAYSSGDQYTVNIQVRTADEATTRLLSITDMSISCEKNINVQGGGASEIG